MLAPLLSLTPCTAVQLEDDADHAHRSPSVVIREGSQIEAFIAPLPKAVERMRRQAALPRPTKEQSACSPGLSLAGGALASRANIFMA
jgi:hypothetical protein